MSILFSEIYTKAFALMNDPKLTVAYETNKIQWQKLMYPYMQNAIGMFENPTSIAVRLADYVEPIGQMEVFEGDGVTNEFKLDEHFELMEDSIYSYTEGSLNVEGKIDRDNRTVIFPDVLPEGKQYSVEQYFAGKFTDDFTGFNLNARNSSKVFLELIKNIVTRLLIKAWAESLRNDYLNTRSTMTDTDFKLTEASKALIANNKYVDQLDNELKQMQNRLGWMIRFAKSNNYIGRG